MSSAAARSATRTGWFISGHAHDGAVADADPLGPGGDGGEEHLRRRAVAVALEEVVLDRPHPVEAQLVGEDRLLEGVRVHEALAAAVERRGHGELEEDAESHGPSIADRTGTSTGRGIGSNVRPCPSAT